MSCRIDLTRFVLQLLPPILRGRMMAALMRAFIVPLRHLYDLFLTYEGHTTGRLAATAHVQNMQDILNREFFLTGNQIRVEQDNGMATPTLRQLTETGETACLSALEEGTVLFVSMQYESFTTIVVWVPTFLCTSATNPAEDKYGWQYLKRITQLTNIHKPAGRPFRIELYDYE